MTHVDNFYMDSMTSTYDDDDDDAHMNVFLEYLQHLFEPTIYHREPEIIELVILPRPDTNNCVYCLVRNIGCILQGGIKLNYKHLYNGKVFSNNDTRIEVYNKAAGLDYHIDSIPYIRRELMTISWRCMMSKNNVYRPISHLSSTISAELQ